MPLLYLIYLNDIQVQTNKNIQIHRKLQVLSEYIIIFSKTAFIGVTYLTYELQLFL